MCYLLVRPEIGSDCHSLELWDRGAEEGRGADGRLNKAHCTGLLSTCCWGKAVRLSFKLSSCPAWVDRLGRSLEAEMFQEAAITARQIDRMRSVNSTRYYRLASESR
jgi:hypothetical protein